MSHRVRLALLMGSVVLLQGCWNFYGGGWLWSETTSGEKVTVGFEGSCSETPNVTDPALNDIRLDIAFTFHDHGFTGEGVYGQNKKGKKHMAIEAAGYHESYGVDGNCADWSEDVEAVVGMLDAEFLRPYAMWRRLIKNIGLSICKRYRFTGIL